MWIIPNNHQASSLSAQGEEDLTKDSEVFAEAESSLLWRSKPSPSLTWYRRWKREKWTRTLFTRILKPSNRGCFQAGLMCFLADIRANHSATPESDSATKTPDTSGPTSLTSSTLLCPDCASLKTSRDTLPKDCAKCSLIWKTEVTKRRGEYSVRKSAALPTEENESSSWPTAAARDWKDSSGMSTERPDRKGNARLDQLPRKVFQQNREDFSMTGKHPVSYPTPTAPNSHSIGSLTEWGGKTWPREISGMHRVKLNPEWVEQLMGFPIGWTDLGSWETP